MPYRICDSVLGDAVGVPVTRKQQAEIKAQSPKLDPIEVDKNIYRTPVFRQRSPREIKKSPQARLDGLPVRSSEVSPGGAATLG